MNRDGTPFGRVAVVGAGAWGTALAVVAARAGRAVRLWAYEAEIADAIASRHENPAYLPGIALDPAITATAELAEAVTGADLVVLATPAQHSRAAARALPDSCAAPLVIAAKGFEQGTLCLMTEAVAAERPGAPLAVLSGPSFATEVARGLPTAVTLASADRALGEAAVRALGGRTFRPYWTDDIIGVQVGGAVKNVLAIAAGVVTGRRLGDNARAALLTRGLAELARLGAAMGGRRETLMGLSGLGDLVLTATSGQSRNTSLGIALGQERSLAEILAERRSVAEGVWTAAAVVGLAARFGIEMPIAAAVDAILNRGAPLDATIAALLDRPFKPEA